MVLKQLADVGVRHRVGVPVVRRAGQHQPDVHPSVAGDAQRAHDVLVGDKIRRRDIKEAARAADELQKGILGGVVGIILRTVEKRLTEAVRCRRGVRPVVVPLLVQLAAEKAPHIEERRGQAPDALALQADAAVLPVAEAVDEVRVLVGDVHAAGVGGLAVDDRDLAVVAVIEIEAVDILVHGVEDDDLHARVAQRLQALRAETLDVAKVVEDDLDLHAAAGALAKGRAHAVPELSLGEDKILHEDEALCRFDATEDILQQQRPLGKIDHFRVLIEVKAAAAQILRYTRPAGQRALQTVRVERAAVSQTLRLLRRELRRRLTL